MSDLAGGTGPTAGSIGSPAEAIATERTALPAFRRLSWGHTAFVEGWALYAAVYLAFAFISTPVEAWIIFLVYGVYFGLTEGTEKALVADLVRPEQRGTAYGLYNLAFSITVLPASLLMGWLWDWRGATTAFAVSAAVGTTSAVLLAFTVRTEAGARGV
jgi:MFS-type transporter involved in bile tolerance (Atg22 family)